MYTYKAVLKRRPNKDGTHTVMIRITYKGVHTHVSAGVRILPKDWDNGKVKKSHPLSGSYNALITKKLHSAEGIAIKATVNDQKITGKGIKGKLKTGSGKSFYKFAEEDFNKRDIKYRSRVKYDQQVALFKKHIGEINAEDITEDTVKQFVKLAQKKQSDNSINRALGTLAGVYKYIIDQKYLPDDNPFYSVKVPARGGKVVRLDKPQVNSLRIELTGSEKMDRDVFLLQFFMGGIRISDVMTMKVSQIKEGRFTFEAMKTGKLQSHILVPEALELLRPYMEGKTGDQYIFPYPKYPVGSKKYYKRLDNMTTRINKTLKKISELAGIETKVTTHISRHSFANVLKNSKASIYQIKDLLGHSSIQMTQRYMDKFDEKEADKAMIEGFASV